MPKLRYGKDPKNWPKPDVTRVIEACEKIKDEKGWLGKRNAAILSTIPLFGSRASENSGLKRAQVEIGADVVFVTFSILKLHHTKKVRCSNCQRTAKFGWNNCPLCGNPLAGLEPLPFKEPPTDIERQRSLKHPLSKYFVDWVREVPLDAYLFPKSTLPGIFGIDSIPAWDKPLKRQSIYMIVRRNLEEYWPHLFRHSLATGFSRVGFSEIDLMKWFGWTRYETAERYTRLGGGARIKSMGEATV